ncbi:MAG: efflux transporter outer membrane subunit [Alphaproteobacteria bacterium]|nr:efflux transporter outer membrane subunit [Alphaproteobacteria bacterium]
MTGLRQATGRAFAAAVAALLGLAACVQVEDGAPPALGGEVVPAAWAAPAGAGPAVWPRPGWWREFGSQELDGLIIAARAANPDLAAAAARVAQAQARARIAGAPLLPAVDASGAADRTGRLSGARPATSLGLGIGASYEVDFWGRNAAELNAARASLAASSFDRATVALTITAATASNYFLVLSLRDRIRIARLNLANAERVLALVEARARSGAVSQLDLARQRAQVEGQRAGIPPLETQEFGARVALALVLGRAPGALAIAARDLGALKAPAVSPGMPTALLARRPDIARAEADLAAASADITVARAAFYPDVRLTGSLDSRANAVSQLFQSTNIAYAVGASVLQAIFDGGARQGAVDLAEERKRELVYAYRSAVLAAIADVESALMDLNSLAREEVARRREAAAARTAFDLAETRYRSGAEDLLTVLDAQRTLYQALDRVAQVRFDRLSALVTLFRALGGGWQALAETDSVAPRPPVDNHG